MKGKVVSFRRSLKHFHKRHFIIDAGCKDREEALKLTGSEVSWKSEAGKIIRGKVSSAHGNKGLIRAIFERGLPGQAVTTEVTIEEGSKKPEKTEAKPEKKVKKEAKK